MPFIQFDADGGHSALSTVTAAQNEVIHVYNTSPFSVAGKVTVGSAVTTRIVDTDGRGPDTGVILSASGSLAAGTTSTAGTDVEFKLPPKLGFFFQVTNSAGGSIDIAEDAVKAAHGARPSVNDKHVYVNLTNATT